MEKIGNSGSMESRLKEEIIKALKSLNELRPDEWDAELLELVKSIDDPKMLLQTLINNIPQITILEKSFEVDSAKAGLHRAINILYVSRREELLKKLIMEHIGGAFEMHLLGIRYVVAAEFILQRMNEDLIYEPDVVSGHLFNAHPMNQILLENVGLARKFAEEEIVRVIQSPTEGENFKKIIIGFESHVKRYIQQNLTFILAETLSRITEESIKKTCIS